MENPVPTLEEVAARAGVSRSTVSRVINGAARVAPQTVAAVRAAIEELDYAPNQAARALATRRTGSLALVIPESDERILTDPFFAATLRGMNTELAGAGQQLVLLIAPRDDRVSRLRTYLSGGHVDGAVVVSHHRGDGLEDALSSARVPTWFVGQPYELLDGVGFVDMDNNSGARIATDHLIERGARRIATITGPLDMLAAADRRRGWQESLTAAGLPLRAEADGHYTVEGGVAAMKAILAADPDIDAVFAASDQMALGALRALALAGRAVPGDVLVCGFDDLGLATMVTPRLTTVRNPVVDMARIATRQVLAEINGEPGPVGLPSGAIVREEGARRDIILPPRLVPGGTT